MHTAFSETNGKEPYHTVMFKMLTITAKFTDKRQKSRKENRSDLEFK